MGDLWRGGWVFRMWFRIVGIRSGFFGVRMCTVRSYWIMTSSCTSDWNRISGRNRFFCDCGVWDVLRAVSIGASPWMVGGDFNTLLSLDERSGGAAPSSVAMSDFHDAIADCALVDAGYIGSPYTWYSRRLRQHLDLVLVSDCWVDVFPKTQVTHL
ncbi:hypothetical protein Salat_2604000 [Sesamum alatum]|uniref:Endonuclease/exonuclease/phosphatase domain-containing protein n=1 Tax=Sesamum alatum TaxID=300844 RepID=A0AAE1XN47_9LAMI|nr:hypothetical protein Salat_2604000 [Sesamum alatum]